LPKIIGNIDVIAGDMDGFGYRAEAASMWRQMILALKQQFDRAPSEYRVHLGVLWEQYGVFLLVCGRQQEAQVTDGEAAAHGNALCDAGISTFIAPSPPYCRYRQQLLFNFGESAAYADASKFVEYCRGLYRSEGTQHAELLALALLWHRDSLMQIGRTSEADAYLHDAVFLVQSRGEASLSKLRPLVSLPCASTGGHSLHSSTLPQPLRFKHPLTRQFDILWTTDWRLSYDRAIMVW
jgi:hypothetical protein